MLVCTALLFASACDNASTEDEAPSLLPAEAFELNTDIFDSTPKAAAGENFTAGAWRVGLISVAVKVHMIIPFVVTAAAVDADPVFQNGEWVWSNTANHGIQSINFSLFAEPVSPGHDWRMVVTYNDGGTVYQQWELYTGHTENLGTEGDWDLYYDVNGTRTNVLNATWDFNSETDRQVVLSVPVDAPTNPGDSVTYMIDGDMRFFEYTNAESGHVHQVEWNSETGEGSVLAPDFNNGEKACWDSLQDDTVCS